MTTAPDLPPPAPRGTRPRNRRAQILDAAAALLFRDGYAGVGMSAIAEAVGIAPSALYRHVAGKQQLLAAVIQDRLDRLVQTLDSTDDPFDSLGATALQHRELGVLWQREGRHLAPADHARARATLRDVRRRLHTSVVALRPGLDDDGADLIARAAMSVLSSPSYVNLDLGQSAYEQLLGSILHDLVATPLPRLDRSPPAPAAPPRLSMSSRREALLANAIVMFAEQGYAGVTMEDVAATVDVSAATIYQHFPSKSDLLVAGFRRGNEWLHRDLSEAVERSADADEALRRLLGSYRRFTFANSQLLDLLITELGSLPPAERAVARQWQNDYIHEWVHLLLTLHPRWGAAPTRLRVQAWFTIVNDVARSPSVADQPAVAEAVEAIGRAILETGT